MSIEPTGQMPLTPLPQASAASPTAALRAASEEVETQFLTQMLRIAGLGKPPESFGGGIGEDQFASLMAEQHARAIVKAGGIGLAESIFQSLIEAPHE